MERAGFDHFSLWSTRYPPDHPLRFREGKDRKSNKYWHPCLNQNGQLIPTTKNDFGPDLHTEFLINFIHDNNDQPFLVYFPMAMIHKKLNKTPDERDAGPESQGTLKANVEYMDKLVGRLVRALERAGVRDNTYIFFTSDNASSFLGRRPDGQYAGKFHDGERGARVPLVINAAGLLRAIGTTGALVDFTDFFPTLAELAGVEDVKKTIDGFVSKEPDLSSACTLDGKSLVPLLEGQTQKHKERIFSYLHNSRFHQDRSLAFGRQRKIL